MSVRKNISQHPGQPFSRWLVCPGKLCAIVSQVAVPLDREWWPASRPVPSDGRSVARVQKQIRTANNLRMCRLMEAEQVEAQLGF